LRRPTKRFYSSTCRLISCVIFFFGVPFATLSTTCHKTLTVNSTIALLSVCFRHWLLACSTQVQIPEAHRLSWSPASFLLAVAVSQSAGPFSAWLRTCFCVESLLAQNGFQRSHRRCFRSHGRHHSFACDIPLDDGIDLVQTSALTAGCFASNFDMKHQPLRFVCSCNAV